MAQISTILGDKELIKTMQTLSNNITAKIMRPAINEGLKPIRQEAKNLATPGNVLSENASGLMKKAIKQKAKAKGQKVSGRVYVDRKTEKIINGKRHVPGYIAHLVEFGHQGPSPAPAHPFMRPALDSKKKEALQKVTNKAKQLLPIEVNKARIKNKVVFK